jgi:hypothetical protein
VVTETCVVGNLIFDHMYFSILHFVKESNVFLLCCGGFDEFLSSNLNSFALIGAWHS